MATARYGILLALIIAAGCKQKRPAPPAATRRAATSPATTQAARPAPPRDYMDLIRLHYPRVATTRALDVPLDLVDAGHFILNEPVYLCTRGDLWITRSDGPDTQETLRTTLNQQTHVVRDRILFVQWHIDDRGQTVAGLIVDGGNGAAEWVDQNVRRPIGSDRSYQWNRAVSWADDKIVVPTDHGVSVFTLGSQPTESYHDLTTKPTPNPPLFTFDSRGVLAWTPWEGGKPGSDGALRFVDGHWRNLNEKTGWPGRLIQLVPLLDGSVLQLSAGDQQTIHVSMSVLDSSGIDEKRIAQLVGQLADPDPDIRKTAFAELQRYGPASWPLLEKLQKGRPLEARVRIRQLLQNRIQPTLGGRVLIEDKGRVVSRFADGGMLIYGPYGVSIPRDDGTSIVINPAWISIRPGRPIQLLDNVLMHDVDPDRQKLFAIGDELILSDPDRGPLRFEGNYLEPLLRKSEAAFDYPVGIDSRGRWLFRKRPDSPQTLILDTTIPDPTPRLPVWILNINGGQVGWEKDGWPVIKRPGAWMLTQYGWQALDEKRDPITTQPPPRPAIASTMPATTRSTTLPAGPPLLVDAEGRAYYDGRQTLTLIDRTGRQAVWPLPNQAIGQPQGEVHLIEAKNKILFLFNAPGRVLRIRLTPAGREPFALDATFTHRVPNVDHPTRIWLDPAGRIIEAYGTHLAIMFPQGRIPSEIENLIPASELDEQAP